MIGRTNCQKMFISLGLKCEISGCLPRTNLMLRIKPLNFISARKFPRKSTGTNPIIVHTHVVSCLLQSHKGYSTRHKGSRNLGNISIINGWRDPIGVAPREFFSEQNKKVSSSLVMTHEFTRFEVTGISKGILDSAIFPLFWNGFW